MVWNMNYDEGGMKCEYWRIYIPIGIMGWHERGTVKDKYTEGM